MNPLESRLRQKWKKFCNDDFVITSLPKSCNINDGRKNIFVNTAIKSSSIVSVEDGEIVDIGDINNPINDIVDVGYDSARDLSESVKSRYKNVYEISLGDSSISSVEELYKDEELSPKWPKKTRFNEFCRFFREGCCRHGINCQFNHDISTSKTRQPLLCRYYDQGKCMRKENCPLLHGEYPCIDNFLGTCNANPCKYSHLPLNDYTRNIVDQVKFFFS